MNSLYSLDINPLSDTWLIKIFPHFVGLFHFLFFRYAEEAFEFYIAPFVDFCFCHLFLESCPKSHCQHQYWEASLCFLLSFMVSGLLVHFNFLWVVWDTGAWFHFFAFCFHQTLCWKRLSFPNGCSWLPCWILANIIQGCLFCFIGLCMYFCASTILPLPVWLYSIVWNQLFFSRLLWLFGLFLVPQILDCSVFV